MNKYIDAERLRKEVKRLEKAAHKSALGCADSETRKFHEGKDFAYQHVGVLIDSLQQEQPEADLEKEYKEWWENKVSGNVNIQHTMEWYMHETARHFYELGKNSK